MFRFAVGATASCTWLPCESECFFKFLLYASPCAAAQSASCLKVGKCWQRPAHAILASLLARALKSTVEKSRSKPFGSFGQSDSSSVKLSEWHFFVLLFLWCFVGCLACFCFRSAGWYDSVVLVSVRRASKPSTGDTLFTNSSIHISNFFRWPFHSPNKPYEDNCVTYVTYVTCNSSQQHFARGLSSTFCPQCHETWHESNESNAGGWFGCFSIRSTSCFRWLGDQMFLKACQFQSVRSEWPSDLDSSSF